MQAFYASQETTGRLTGEKVDVRSKKQTRIYFVCRCKNFNRSNNTWLAAPCMQLLRDLGIPLEQWKEKDQTDYYGFFTSKNRYVSRQEAAKIAFERGANSWTNRCYMQRGFVLEQ